LVLAAFAAACSPDGAVDGKGTTSAAAPADSAGNDGADAVAASQGREYTRWFYDREFDKLWAKFSPEMRRTFATPAELATLAGRTVEGFGAEQGGAVESVTREDSVRVYTRKSRFERSPDSVMVQWTVRPDGTVTGFVIRPAPDDSTAS
jgi:hypothetical protein